MHAEQRRALGLFALTLLSMFWVGAQHAGADVERDGLLALWRGHSFALPFMAILLAHELGHMFAARAHGEDASLPYFLPMPLVLTGTLGAVVLTREQVRSRDALFDVGAAGPWSGLLVALPVLAYGIVTSPVAPLDPTNAYVHEGHSLLYDLLLMALRGPFPPGHDIMLNPVALAGWSGLLVTMINLVPTGQLDGGHVAWALFGARQQRYGRVVRACLLVFALGQAAYFSAVAWPQSPGPAALLAGLLRASEWLVLWVVLLAMEQLGEEQAAPLEDNTLSPKRRLFAWLTLLLFGLLFMPTWMATS